MNKIFLWLCNWPNVPRAKRDPKIGVNIQEWDRLGAGWRFCESCLDREHAEQRLAKMTSAFSSCRFRIQP